MGKYLYCFIKEKEKVSFGTSRIGNLNAPVYTLNYNDISAVVSEAPIIDYDPSRKNIMAHQNVIKKVMEKYAVIPVAFGTVANNKKEVLDIIRNSYEEFLENIRYLSDKVELGLKVTWNNDYFNKDIENDEIIKLKNKIVGKEENEILSDKIKLGQLVEAAIMTRREEYENDIYLSLAAISEESKLKENLPIKTVLNGYFLVSKSKENTFDAKVQELAGIFENKLVFSYTGPWPPYNFVSMSLRP